ncbi:MAG: hypothetical protein FIA95_10785 [Gemmatimonadetes bacterium]|nr:hypothetical protein [Gemmatimonadota bacterium]
MSSATCFLPTWVSWTELVSVNPVFGAFLAYGPEPPADDAPSPADPPQGRLPLTYWVDGHPVASRWYPYDTYAAIRDSTFFAEPATVYTMAAVPHDPAGWMTMFLAAVGTSDGQAAELLRLHRDPIVAPLVHTLSGRVGLGLGHHWIRVPVDVQRHLDHDNERTRAYVAEFCSQVSRLILRGTDEQVAARLLCSIPGIRGERPDPVC